MLLEEKTPFYLYNDVVLGCVIVLVAVQQHLCSCCSDEGNSDMFGPKITDLGMMDLLFKRR